MAKTETDEDNWGKMEPKIKKRCVKGIRVKTRMKNENGDWRFG